MSHLFLTGHSGIGKSTLLMDVLKPRAHNVSGFLTQRQLMQNRMTGGFRLLPWKGDLPLTADYHPEDSDLFIKKTADGWEKDLSVFETTGLKLLHAAMDNISSASILCLDEIGGTELLVPGFCSRLYEVLAEHPCCIGVIKSPQNLSSMLTRVAMKSRETELLLQLHRDLIQKFDSKIVEVTEENKLLVREQLHTLLAENEVKL